MFENLVKVVISINEYSINNIIIIDNYKKDISFNGKYINLKINEFNLFLESFFRIIREWKSQSNEKNENIILSIKIIEKENQYKLYISHCIPKNFDSFLDLIHNLNEK